MACIRGLDAMVFGVPRSGLVGLQRNLNPHGDVSLVDGLPTPGPNVRYCIHHDYEGRGEGGGKWIPGCRGDH